ncbi:MAG: sensor histidine kinase [Clostridiaceae bacterium]
MKISFFKGIRFKILKAFLLSVFIAFFITFFLILSFLKVVYNVSYSNWGSWTNEHIILNTYILLIFFLLFIVITTMFFYIFTRNIIKHIEDINESISIISGGNFDVSIPILTDDELGVLSNNVNIMTKRLRDLINKERENEKIKNDMISNISHDLRTPLTSVIGYVEMMQKLEDGDKNLYDNCINIILNKCGELKGLIEDLLEYTSINFNKLNIKQETIKIKDVIEQIMIGFIPTLEKSDMDFSIKISDESPFIIGDIKLIVRLFENIISNSIFYGKDGKKVDIEIITLDPFVSINIINYGPKILKEDVEHIFERFYRGEKSRNSHTGGRGMGLAIAKSIADINGGDIKVSSNDTETVFQVLLKKV